MEQKALSPAAVAAVSGSSSGSVALAAVGSSMSKELLKTKTDGETGGNGLLDADSSPSVDQKLFLVVSVALATVCFFTNVVQVGVFLRPSALRSVKSLLLLSQALSGIFASFVVAFPIHVISARGGSAVGESGFNSCYLGHSGIIIVTLLTSLSTATLLLLHYYLTNNHPRKYTAVGNSLAGWGGAVLGVWVYSFGIALLPWAGWNSWITHDARCHLSTLWPLSFTTFLTFLVGAHMAATLFMWASSRAAQLKASDARLTTRVNRTPAGVIDSEAVPITHTITQGNTEGRVGLCGWAITVSSTVPLMGHVVVASSCAASALCLSSPHHYHEDAAALPWASLLLTAAAVANPLLYVFSDDQVSSTTLMVLSRMCCCWRKGRQERLVSRQSESRDAETNVYVTNDTDHLVADNT